MDEKRPVRTDGLGEKIVKMGRSIKVYFRRYKI